MNPVGFLIYNYYRNSFGKYILGIFFASLNNGAICDGVNPAIPHPIGVTKNFKSGCFLAKSINSSTQGLIVSTPPCMVGMAQDCPCNPVPCPHTAPNFLYAVNAAPPPCIPSKLLPKTNTSLRANLEIYDGVILISILNLNEFLYT